MRRAWGVWAIWAVLAGPAVGAEAWVGIWSAEPGWCANAAHVGSRTPAPVQLTPTEFLGYENSCALRKVTRVGGLPAWQLEMECQSEGSVYDDAALVLLEGPDVLWWVAGPGEPVRFARCP